MKSVRKQVPAATLVAAILLAVGCSESPDVANQTRADRDTNTAADAQRRTADNGDLSRYDSTPRSASDTEPRTASDKDKDRVVAPTTGGRANGLGMDSRTSETAAVPSNNAHPVVNSGQNKVDRNGVATTPIDQSVSDKNKTGTPTTGGNANTKGMDSRTSETSAVPSNKTFPVENSGQNKVDRNGVATTTGTTAAAQAASDKNKGVNSANESAEVTTVSNQVDNSGQNKVDRSGASMTPMDQGSSDADIGITRNIRKALTGDDRLSTNAQNLKVITSNAVVVLRGPVASQAEAELVRTHVRSVGGISRIEDQIAVP